MSDTRRKEVLGALIENRYDVTSDEFKRAFNAIAMYWGNEDVIKKLVFEFKNSGSEGKTQILTEIIYQLCILEGISHLSREDILNVFKAG
jgi:hypothetical protein